LAWCAVNRKLAHPWVHRFLPTRWSLSLPLSRVFERRIAFRAAFYVAGQAFEHHFDGNVTLFIVVSVRAHTAFMSSCSL
jgi:hypothetical protein